MSKETTKSASKPLHIGFLAKDFLAWRGGVWFVQNLLRGLVALPSQNLTVTIFVPSDSTPRIMLRRLAQRLKKALRQPLQAWSALTSPSAERSLWTLGVRELTAILPRVVIYDDSEADLLRRSRLAGVDVLMPVMTPLKNSDIPWVGYLYDCQHRHHPEFFSASERAVRDRNFELMLQRADVVFANARAVITDLQTFFPDGHAKLFSLPHAPLIRESELRRVGVDDDVGPVDVGESGYFIVCNQFWIHKDHETAFRAFARFVALPDRAACRLLCTGLTEDYRFPDHFGRLKALVAELGIADRVVFTGYIDRAEQLALVHGALAVLQPTLFEGGPGGGAASDALALGVPCVLSDIPVNLELQDALAFFFRVGNPESLAEAMESVAAHPPNRPSKEALLDANLRHARVLGDSLVALATVARTA